MSSLTGSAGVHAASVGLLLLAGAARLQDGADPAMAVAAVPPAPVGLDVRLEPPVERPAFEVDVPLPSPIAPEEVELDLALEPSDALLEEPPAPRIAPERPAPRLDRPLATTARTAPPAGAPDFLPQVEAERAPTEIHNPAPPYPGAARRRGQEGLVVVELAILADGRVAEAKVVESAGSDLFIDAVLRTVKEWRYEPATLGGAPVACVQRVRFNFRLN